MKLKHLSILGPILTLSTICYADLTVEVVDDTLGASPYILLVGKPIAGTPLTVNAGSGTLALADASQAHNAVTPTLVSQLADSGKTILSPYTGKTRKIRSFTVNTLGSGALMVFQNYGNGAPFAYTNNANPNPVTANFRFDQCEITYNATIQSGCNLTSIDQFAIPMQFELFTGASTNLTQVDHRKFYLSTESLVKAFHNMNSSTMPKAIYKLGSSTNCALPGWTSSDGMTNFVRVLGPGKIASINVPGNPAPFPSFSKYLSSLASANYQFKVSGNACGSTYHYTGTVRSAGSAYAGYQVYLTGTTWPAPSTNSVGHLLPKNAPVTVNFPTQLKQATATSTTNTTGQISGIQLIGFGSGYMSPPIVTVAGPSGGKGTTATAKATIKNGVVTGIKVINPGSGYTNAIPVVTVNQPTGSADTFLYGATLSADSFWVGGMTPEQVADDSNIVYGAIARDVLAAINFGYMQSKYPYDNNEYWCGTTPTCYPFGQGRKTNDGFYNPWAALIYNHSDSYGFAFSDRSGPSPLMDLQNNQTLRITILPDSRLDSPQNVKVTSGDTSLGLTWDAVTGATGYRVKVLSPMGIPSQSPTSTSATLSNLKPGTPYTFTVEATGASNGGATLRSPAQSIQAITTGATKPYTSYDPTKDYLTYNMSMSWNPPSYYKSLNPPLRVAFNGAGPNYQLTWHNTSTNWSNKAGTPATLNGRAGTNQYVMSLMDGNGSNLFSSIVSACFIPNPRATATAAASAYNPTGSGPAWSIAAITNLTLTSGGSGYPTQAGFAPTVTFSGKIPGQQNPGSGATATASVSSTGSITGLVLTSGGNVYPPQPTVNISSTFAVTNMALYGNAALTPNVLPSVVSYYGTTPGATYLTLTVPLNPYPLKAFGPITFPSGGSSFKEASSKGWVQPKGSWVPIEVDAWFSTSE